MQISASPSPAPATAPNAPVTTHEDLGTLKFCWGLEECEAWWSRDAIRAGQVVGAAAGYATLADAVQDLAPRTENDAAPAATRSRDHRGGGLTEPSESLG